MVTAGEEWWHKEGFLTKRGHWRRNWLSRFFSLNEDVLSYYDRPGDRNPKGTIVLDGAVLQEVVEDVKKPYVFSLTEGRKGKRFLIQCSSEEQREVSSPIRLQGAVIRFPLTLAVGRFRRNGSVL